MFPKARYASTRKVSVKTTGPVTRGYILGFRVQGSDGVPLNPETLNPGLAGSWDFVATSTWSCTSIGLIEVIPSSSRGISPFRSNY